MKKILVTGVAGFIGSNLVEYLLNKNNDYCIIGVDNFDDMYDREIKEANIKNFLQNPNFEFVELDLTQATKVNLLPKVDLVVHLAAKAGVRPSILNPQAYIHSNIYATQNLLDWMRIHHIKKYIFASSSSVYGNNKKVPFEESDNVDKAISPYAFTKKSCEILNHTYHHLYHIDCINLRFFTVYGPRQRPDLAIHKFVENMLANKPIQVFGNGQTARDYTYIMDIVAGIEQAIQLVLSQDKIFEIINLGSNYPIKLMDLIKHIENILQIKTRLIYMPMQDGDVEFTFANIDKAKKLLNYHPQENIEDGLKKFIAWKTN